MGPPPELDFCLRPIPHLGACSQATFYSVYCFTNNALHSLHKLEDIICHCSVTSMRHHFYFLLRDLLTPQPLLQLKPGSRELLGHRPGIGTWNTLTFFENPSRIQFNSVMSISSKPAVFRPQDACDTPSDVTIIVEDGKEFQAHKHILADASPFFEKLLSTEMRESKDGVVRLQMLTESVLGDILEFIYTGCVQISDEDRAHDLIAMADYLFLPQLKSLAGDVLTRDINCSNCVSRYNSGETYQYEELISASYQKLYLRKFRYHGENRRIFEHVNY